MFCKNCTTEFTITDVDKKFYAKINVPEPTWCPDCRRMRRSAFRNERYLYPRKCALCNDDILSNISLDKPYTVYCNKCWYSDKWNPLDYGQDYDPGRSFFEQFYELSIKVPHFSVVAFNTVNSDYCNYAMDSKNCYLGFAIRYDEDCMYCYWLYHSKDCLDCSYCFRCELCYWSIFIHDSYNLKYCLRCQNCNDSWFLRDCSGCSNCLMCTNLHNKQYHILNKAYSKEEYDKKMEEFNLQSREGIRETKKLAEKFWAEQPNRFAVIHKSQDCIGDQIRACKKARDCFRVDQCEEINYVNDASYSVNDSMDVAFIGTDCELCYECLASEELNSSKFIFQAVGLRDVEYSESFLYVHDSFGCVGINKGEYFILNKKYSPEEYFRLRDQIISDMKKRGEYGEFFPIQYSPYAYNESKAQEYFPLTKEEVVVKGWNWQENLPGTFGKETIKEVADLAGEINEKIISEVLACAKCNKNFKILSEELKFYQERNLPLPIECHNCRYLERMEWRNPMRLWQRQCECEESSHGHDNKCFKDFMTPYNPDREEVLYCEECYNKETY